MSQELTYDEKQDFLSQAKKAEKIKTLPDGEYSLVTIKKVWINKRLITSTQKIQYFINVELAREEDGFRYIGNYNTFANIDDSVALDRPGGFYSDIVKRLGLILEDVISGNAMDLNIECQVEYQSYNKNSGSKQLLNIIKVL